MKHAFRPGQLVEIVRTAPEFCRYLGMRFVLERIVPVVSEPLWISPWMHGGALIVCEEWTLRPVDTDADIAFQRFVTKLVQPREVETV